MGSRQTTDGFRLRLANGQSWHLMAVDEARSLVERLAAITELQGSAPCPDPDETRHPATHGQARSLRLIFCHRSSGKRLLFTHPTGERLPLDGWTVHEFVGLRMWSHRHVSDVICEIGPERTREVDLATMCFALFPIYQRAQMTGGFPVHAALVEKDNQGVLLAAPGNTGKSTCCRRLPPEWRSVCDDESLVVRDDQNRYLVHPFPTWSDHLWKPSGRTWNVQHHVPLEAIFFLEQAKRDEVVPVGEGQSAVRISRSATQVLRRSMQVLNQDERLALATGLFANACDAARGLPCYVLRCSRTGRFWDNMEEVLQRSRGDGQRSVAPASRAGGVGVKTKGKTHVS